MNILAGSTLGGGTRVNWQASFRTPDHVRKEWAQEHGLPAFTSAKFDHALDAVCTRLGVTTGGQLVRACEFTSLTCPQFLSNGLDELKSRMRVCSMMPSCTLSIIDTDKGKRIGLGKG